MCVAHRKLFPNQQYTVSSWIVPVPGIVRVVQLSGSWILSVVANISHLPPLLDLQVSDARKKLHEGRKRAVRDRKEQPSPCSHPGTLQEGLWRKYMKQD